MAENEDDVEDSRVTCYKQAETETDTDDDDFEEEGWPLHVHFTKSGEVRGGSGPGTGVQNTLLDRAANVGANAIKDYDEVCWDRKGVRVLF